METIKGIEHVTTSDTQGFTIFLDGVVAEWGEGCDNFDLWKDGQRLPYSDVFDLYEEVLMQAGEDDVPIREATEAEKAMFRAFTGRG